MTITIELKPELEDRLQKEVAKSGIDAGAFVARVIEERLRQRSQEHLPPQLSREEGDLLQKINQGLPEMVWREYRRLIGKRRAETLTREEHARLIVLSNDIEEAHAARMAHVYELARLRQLPLNTVMQQLGLKPRKVLHAPVRGSEARSTLQSSPVPLE